MRFPHKAYAEMVASEKSVRESRQVAAKVADEKKRISESAIEDDVDETDGFQSTEDDEEGGEE